MHVAQKHGLGVTEGAQWFCDNGMHEKNLKRRVNPFKRDALQPVEAILDERCDQPPNRRRKRCHRLACLRFLT
jgi:hypothetical protein